MQRDTWMMKEDRIALVWYYLYDVDIAARTRKTIMRVSIILK